MEKAREFQKNIYFCFLDYAKAFDCVDHNKLGTILKEMGIPDHLTCLLRNRYAGQEATVRNGHGTTDWFQIGKGVRQGCIFSPCLFNLYAEQINNKVLSCNPGNCIQCPVTQVTTFIMINHNGKEMQKSKMAVWGGLTNSHLITTM